MSDIWIRAKKLVQNNGNIEYNLNHKFRPITIIIQAPLYTFKSLFASFFTSGIFRITNTIEFWIEV